jgi:hypothetical protein
MSREAHIPLALWIPAALVAHFMGGKGANEAAQVLEDRAQLRGVVQAVREGLRPPDTTFEILLEGVEATPSPQAAAPPKEDPADPPADGDEPVEPDPNAKPDERAKPAKTPKVAAVPPANTTPPPEPEKPKPEEAPKAPEPVAKVEPVPVPVVPAAPPPPPPESDKRLMIRQHVEKDQEDNTTAKRAADDANHTEEETVARTRSYDQDHPDPSPGSHAGPKGSIGDNDHDKHAHSEDKQGDPTHAPGEARKSSTSPEHSNPTPPSPAQGADKGEPTMRGKQGGGERIVQAPAPPTAPAPPARAGGAGPASPEVIDTPNGGYSLDPANPGGDGRSRTAGRKRTPRYSPPVKVGSVGLGSPGVLGGPNINLTMAGVEAAVGSEQLKAERAADGASRRSAHRGSYETNKFERWRAAIENYEPSVKLGNQTSLNAARVPFATYINTIHNRLHPIFAEEFLASLDALPAGHSLNQELVTHIEIVLNKEDGRIVRLGVTKASGVTAFDIVALNSISRAQPYGKAPDAVISPDGNVYLHWEFHRDPFDACTTRNARPYILKNPPAITPTAKPPKKGPSLAPADERNAPPTAPLLPLK